MNDYVIHWDVLIVVISQVVYFFAAFILNLFLYMIGNFYRKKLGERMFLFGFIVAMIALVIALVGTFVGTVEYGVFTIGVSIIVAGSATLINGSLVYYAMKRAHS